MRKPYIVAIKALIAGGFLVALIVWVHLSLGWRKVFAQWSEIPVYLIFIVIACVLASHALRVIRVYLAYCNNFTVELRAVAGVSLVHNTVSFLLPMRLGEAALPLLSRHKLNIDLSYSTSALIMLRIFDAHWLLLLLLAFSSSSFLEQQARIISASILLTSPVVLALIIFWLRKQAKFSVLKSLVSRTRTLIMLYAITGAIWLVKLAALALLATAMGDILLHHAWTATILADASALSPVTGFANAGTFEVAFAFPLLLLGYNSEQLLSVSLNLHLLILITNLIAGAAGMAFLLTKKSI